MKKILIAQYYEVNVPDEFETKTPIELLNTLNFMYDVCGKSIIKALGAEDDYIQTELVEIDDEVVFIEGNIIGDSGYNIILDGQQIEEEGKC